MARLVCVLGLGVVLALCDTSLARASQQPPVYQVIVQPENPVSNVDRTFLEDVFLKKTKEWPDGAATRPVDQAASSNVRRHFTEEVLRRPVEAVRTYWQQKIFSGRDVPPPELDGDGAVVAYVMSHDGAVGYVSGNADLHGAKVLAVRP